MYEEQIMEYVKANEVFTTEELRMKIKITNRDRLYKDLRKLCDLRLLYHYCKGIYGYEKYSDFWGEYYHNTPEEALAIIYTKDNNGYISGADFFNAIGLSTWCAAKKIITSNKVKRKTEKFNLIIFPPKETITKENLSYLQFLDCLEDISNYAVDSENPEELLKNYVYEKKLNVDTLRLMLKEHYRKQTQDYFERIMNYVT